MSVARSTAWCAEEGRQTRWRLTGETATGPKVQQWACLTCSNTRWQLGDVTDAERLIRHVVDEYRRQHPPHPKFDREEVILQLHEDLWLAYTQYDGRGTFKGYATWRLRNAVVSWIRRNIGYTAEQAKPHAVADSYDDGGGLEQVVAAGSVDGREDRTASLAGVLARRRAELHWLDGRLRETATTRSARRA